MSRLSDFLQGKPPEELGASVITPAPDGYHVHPTVSPEVVRHLRAHDVPCLTNLPAFLALCTEEIEAGRLRGDESQKIAHRIYSRVRAER